MTFVADFFRLVPLFRDSSLILGRPTVPVPRPDTTWGPRLLNPLRARVGSGVVVVWGSGTPPHPTLTGVRCLYFFILPFLLSLLLGFSLAPPSTHCQGRLRL